VVIQPIVDAEPLAAAIEAGDIQLIGGNPPAPELIDRFVANADLVVDETAEPGFQSVWINPWHRHEGRGLQQAIEELMKEKGFKVRLAMAKGLDREGYIKQAIRPRHACFGTVNPAMAAYFDGALSTPARRPSTLAAAKQLMADAGYPDGRASPSCGC
jgi:ABC-type transport system substrate-binding protein